MGESITLRTYLTGALNDLVESAELGALGKCSMVCEIVSLIADYKEEGSSLFLDVFVVNNLSALTDLLPQSTYLRIGTVSFDEAGVKSALKKVAPLVRGSWRMYFSGNGGDLEFGLFRDSGHPLSVPIDIMLKPGEVGDARYIRITKLTRDVVKLSTQKGKDCVLNFTNAKASVADISGSIKDLAEIICDKVDSKIADTCKTYTTSLLTKMFRESHGCLIGVVKSSKLPSFLSDCTVINPPIDLCGAVDAVLRDAAAIVFLQALENLIVGIFNSDGIVIFNRQAQLLAYNCFIKLKSSKAVGGARRRAFEAMCNKLDKGIIAAYYQSQDGASELRRGT
jgi:hypothetical protein